MSQVLAILLVLISIVLIGFLINIGAWLYRRNWYRMRDRKEPFLREEQQTS